MKVKNLIKLYIGITVLLLFDLILYLLYDISLPGHWADWILFWMWFIFTLAVTTLEIKKKWAITYVLALLFLIMLSLIPMGIPFLSILFFAIEPKIESYQLSSRLRLEENSKSVLAMPKVIAIKNYYLFEKVIGETGFHFRLHDYSYQIEDAEEIIQIRNNTSDSLTVKFKFKDGTITRVFKEN